MRFTATTVPLGGCGPGPRSKFSRARAAGGGRGARLIGRHGDGVILGRGRARVAGSCRRLPRFSCPLQAACWPGCGLRGASAGGSWAGVSKKPFTGRAGRRDHAGAYVLEGGEHFGGAPPKGDDLERARQNYISRSTPTRAANADGRVPAGRVPLVRARFTPACCLRDKMIKPDKELKLGLSKIRRLAVEFKGAGRVRSNLEAARWRRTAKKFHTKPSDPTARLARTWSQCSFPLTKKIHHPSLIASRCRAG